MCSREISRNARARLSIYLAIYLPSYVSIYLSTSLSTFAPLYLSIQFDVSAYFSVSVRHSSSHSPGPAVSITRCACPAGMHCVISSATSGSAMKIAWAFTRASPVSASEHIAGSAKRAGKGI